MAIPHPDPRMSESLVPRSRPLSDRRDITLHSTLGRTRLPPRGWNLAVAEEGLDPGPPPLVRAIFDSHAPRFWPATTC
jgi:hypothetical protein